MDSSKDTLDFPGGSDGKESACNAGDSGLIPGLGRSSGEWNGNPLQYSCLENSMDIGAWQASPWGHRESDMTEQLTLSLFSQGHNPFFLIFVSIREEKWDLRIRSGIGGLNFFKNCFIMEKYT